MKVLLLSSSYMPITMASDKQFYRQIILKLLDFAEFVVWSINDWPNMVISEEVEEHIIKVYGKSRFLHLPKYRKDDILNGNYKYNHHSGHSGIRNLCELSLTVIRNLYSLKKVIDEEKPDLIHLTDNFGPILPMIKMLAGECPISVTKIAISTKMKLGKIYSFLLKYGVGTADSIIVGTRAAEKQLTEGKIVSNLIRMIHWGVDLGSTENANRSEIENIRKRYGLTSGEFLVVVSLQTAKSQKYKIEGFKTVIDELFKLSREISALKFVVAIKPDHWMAEMASYQSNYCFIEKGPSDYLDLLKASDFLYSPTFGRFNMRTITPPLAWLEAMARRNILITTKGIGLEELIINGETGIIYDNIENLAGTLKSLIANNKVETIKDAARQLITKDYSIDKIALDYFKVWEELLKKNNFSK